MLHKLSDIPKLLCSGILLFIFSFSVPLFSQKNISGTINQYRKITAIGTDSTNVTVTNVLDGMGDPIYAVSDTVLVMQMAGVIIANEAVIQGVLGTPGGYEFLVVSAVNTGTNTVTFTQKLRNKYDTKGLMQLVTVPSYNSAVVSSALTCAQWDYSTGTGGVLAFVARRRLTLNAGIDVKGKGFKGGAVSHGAGVCAYVGGADYQLGFYDILSDYSGFKGEGVANKFNNDATDIYPANAKGRVPALTGGGGGNGYSSGGGGGSGYGAGSKGDSEFSSQCGAPFSGGNVGKAISGTIIEGNVFMGGGGGASTYPNSTANLSAGANGGGIVIIFADTIASNGQMITADGADAIANTVMGAGGGGGGGGGSVIIESRYLSSNLSLSVSGGNGANTVNSSAGCAGGGGGGGLIWTKGTYNGTYDINGGAGGLRAATPSLLNGDPGRITTGLVIPLNGFLYNAVYSERTLSETDSICSETIPPPLVGTQPFGGAAPYTYRWQKSYDSINWINTSGTGMYYTPSVAETDTLWFRRFVTDANDLPDYSRAVKIIVHAKISDNIVGKDTVICDNPDPLPLVPLVPSPSGGNGAYNYSWQQSTDNASWVDAGSTGSSIDPGSLLSTTFFRRTVNSGACVDPSASVKVTLLNPVSDNSILTPNQVICEGTQFTDLSGSLPSDGDGTYRYEWRSSPNGTDWETAPGAGNSQNYNPTNDAAGTYYFSRVVMSGLRDCCKSTSAPVILVSHPDITNNIIVTSPQTICAETMTPDLIGSVPENGSGTYTYQWLKNDDIASGANSKDYNAETLVSDTYYNRIVNSSACRDTSESVLISVIPVIENYEIALEVPANSTICSGANPGKISGHVVTGGILNDYSYHWYYSADNSNFQPLSDVTPDYQPGALTKTSWYCRSVTSGPCIESDTIKITVLPLISGNVISDNQHICNVNIPSLLSGQNPSGGDGAYSYSWIQKDELNTQWELAQGSNISKNYSPSRIDLDTEYRRVVLSGQNNCCIDTSNIVVIQVDSMPQNITAGEDAVLNPYQFAAILHGYFDGTGTGVWNVESSDGDPVFDNKNAAETAVRKLGFGDNVFSWQVTNGVCVADADYVSYSVPKIIIPEGFSPNGDNINETFIIEGLEYTTNELVIINTGGAVVYKTSNYRSDIEENAWDGVDNNGDPLPDGTYYFLLTIKGATDISIPKYEAHLSGFIIIRR